MTNKTYLTATEVMQLIQKLADYYGPDKPIRIILDNARYQKCVAVRALIEKLRGNKYDIELVYLPSYSPNLNLIERLWRYVKTQVKSSFILEFPAFCNNIDSIISSTEGEAKASIDSLIGEKIQFYDSLKPVDAHSFVMPKKKKEENSNVA